MTPRTRILLKRSIFLWFEASSEAKSAVMIAFGTGLQPYQLYLVARLHFRLILEILATGSAYHIPTSSRSLKAVIAFSVLFGPPSPFLRSLVLRCYHYVELCQGSFGNRFATLLSS